MDQVFRRVRRLYNLPHVDFVQKDRAIGEEKTKLWLDGQPISPKVACSIPLFTSMDLSRDKELIVASSLNGRVIARISQEVVIYLSFPQKEVILPENSLIPLSSRCM